MNTTQYADLIPSYEHERLEALQPYQVLSTPGQDVFNSFVGVVAKLFDMPIALISLVRDDDVVFVGNQGLPEATIMSREDSMCSVAILQDGLTVFGDIATEPCELVNPFVARHMGLGFYAGQALRAPGGMPIGSLCVLDRQPRQLSPAEGQLLEALALVAQDLLLMQARQATGTAAALRLRLDGPLHDSFARFATLAEIHQLTPTADAAEAQRYAAARIDEAQHMARIMHRELQTVLAGLGQ